MSVVSAVTEALGWKPKDRSNIEVLIDDLIYSGWTDVVIRCGVDIMPWSAQLTMTVRDPETGTFATLSPGQACQLRIGGALVITGYICTTVEQVSAFGHQVSVVLASKSIDLVECSALMSSYQMNDTNALHIAQQVCAPFGLTITSINGAGNADITSFAVTLTESGYQVIERLCRLSGVLFYDTPDGNIVFSGIGPERAASGFNVGGNIEASAFRRSQDGCYSEITAVLQNSSVLFEPPDKDKLAQQMAALTTGIVARDETVERERPLLVPVEVGDANFTVTRQRVQWEMARRQGRGVNVNVTCDSWCDDAGDLWRPNTCVTFTDLRHISSEWIISEVTFKLGPDGSHADLMLVKPEALTPQPTLNPLVQTELNVAVTQ